MPIKESKLDLPLFRGLEGSYQGMKVSNTVTITATWLRERMKHLGEVTGFELPIRLYCFRRGNSEALDNSSLSLLKL